MLIEDLISNVHIHAYTGSNGYKSLAEPTVTNYLTINDSYDS